jgi:hypothetical protein
VAGDNNYLAIGSENFQQVDRTLSLTAWPSAIQKTQRIKAVKVVLTHRGM